MCEKWECIFRETLFEVEKNPQPNLAALQASVSHGFRSLEICQISFKMIKIKHKSTKTGTGNF